MADGDRLADADSPFLRHGAEQPVEWRPWGEDAFEEAKELDRPILLDSGAVWCHWCHVMDHESYEDPEIAAYINDHFVPVKIDRDARPDVDQRYQEAVQAMTGQGGWPLTAFLTPEGKPFYGGTYFPPEPKMGRPSFKQVLEAVVDQYEQKPDDVRSRAESLVGQIQARVGPKPGEIDAFYLDQGLQGLRRRHDRRHGGFGDAPKFPHPPVLDLMLAHHWETGEAWPLEIVETTLEKMAAGGIHDHVGGGFHRYSTDARWLVPHFEKMSYDNAGLMASYAEAHAVTGRSRFADVAQGVVGHVMSVSDGPALYASQDADVGPGDDGSYWTWTPKEIEKASPDHGRLLIRHFGVTEEGNMRHGDRTVLEIARPADELAEDLDAPVEKVEERLKKGRKDLLKARGRREEPFVDTTPYANWNGLLIQGLVRTAWALGDEEAGQAAVTALDFVLENMVPGDEGVLHVWNGTPSTPGLLDDNVQVGRACLAVHQHTGDDRYLDAARTIADLLVEEFVADDGGFVDSAPSLGDAPLGERVPVHDNPEPSPNGSAVLFLDQLSRLIGGTSYQEAGRDALQAVAGSIEGNVHSGTLLGALWCMLHDAPTVTVLGDPEDATTRRLHRAALRTFAPWKVVIPPGADHVPDAAPDDAEGVVVCRGTTCTRPATTVDEVAQRLGSAGSASA